jgi:sulfur carrier protein
MPLSLIVNGQSHTFAGLSSLPTLAEVIAELKLKGDRIAVEHNGNIAPRARWPEITVASGDKLEVVHFVGGGLDAGERPFDHSVSIPTRQAPTRQEGGILKGRHSVTGKRSLKQKWNHNPTS